MSAYLLGLLTLPAIALVTWVVTSIALWCLWWRNPDTGARKGLSHDLAVRENGRWYPGTRHTHWWPSDTPWWLIRRLEPLRIRICLRNPDHRTVAPGEDS